MEEGQRQEEQKQGLTRRKFIEIGLAGGGALAAATIAHYAIEGQKSHESKTKVEGAIDEIRDSENVHWQYYEQKALGLIDLVREEGLPPTVPEMAMTVTANDAVIYNLRVSEGEASASKRVYSNEKGKFEDMQIDVHELSLAIPQSTFIGIETTSTNRTVSLSTEQKGEFWRDTTIQLKRDIVGEPANIIEKQVVTQYISAKENVDFVLQKSQRITPEGQSSFAHDPEYSLRLENEFSTASQNDLSELTKVFEEQFK